MPSGERYLRPAVIAREVSCGNKTAAGKRSFEVLRSVASSCLKRGHDVVSYIAGLLPFGARATRCRRQSSEPTCGSNQGPAGADEVGVRLPR